MDGTEWKELEDVLNKEPFEILDTGPLHSPVTSFSIERDENLHLYLNISATQEAVSNAVEYPAGTVRTNVDTVSFLGASGIQVIGTGIQPLGVTRTTDHITGESLLRERCSIHSLESKPFSIDTPSYIVEWVANIDNSYFMWPDRIDEEAKEVITKKVGSKTKAVVIKHTYRSSSLNRACVRIRIDGHDVYVGHSIHRPKADKLKLGFIIFTGNPSEDKRKKIRNCVSFSMGRPLAYIGHTTYTKAWKVISYKSISPNLLDGKILELHTMPPSPLGLKYQHELDPNIFSQMISSIYKHYDNLDLGRIFWYYWHALCSPIHISGVHFGAIIESVQKAYINANKSKFQTTLLKKEIWKLVHPELSKIIDGIKIDDVTRKILLNKLSQLNQVPQSLLNERFFNIIGLKLSELETNSWKQRHSAAHGNEIKDDEYIGVIRDTKLLKLIFHRILLRITKSNQHYHDYYTIGFPIRNVGEPVIEENYGWNASQT